MLALAARVARKIRRFSSPATTLILPWSSFAFQANDTFMKMNRVAWLEIFGRFQEGCRFYG